MSYLPKDSLAKLREKTTRTKGPNHEINVITITLMNNYKLFKIQGLFDF